MSILMMLPLLPTIILMDVPQPNAFRSTFTGLDNTPWGAQRLEAVWTIWGG